VRPVNKARSGKIARALVAAGYEGATDWGATVTDALCDLRHLCDAHALEFGRLDRLAHEHYSAELHASDDLAQDAESRFNRTGKL
jgi:hypothetical protein